MLIPKVKAPIKAKDYRPISLCNVIYKIITKLLVNRMKTILSMIISPEQSAFVSGRIISDRVFAAQEILQLQKGHKLSYGYQVGHGESMCVTRRFRGYRDVTATYICRSK